MTSNINAFGTLRILEAIRYYSKKTKFYQASTSEMFGGLKDEKFQNEMSRFRPKSPYAVSKLYAHWISNIYREGLRGKCLKSSEHKVLKLRTDFLDEILTFHFGTFHPLILQTFLMLMLDRIWFFCCNILLPRGCEVYQMH